MAWLWDNDYRFIHIALSLGICLGLGGDVTLRSLIVTNIVLLAFIVKCRNDKKGKVIDTAVVM